MKTRRRNYSEGRLTLNRCSKRVKTSENGGENALPIPIDLVFEIFSRLPVKCIARCRCVSKIWASMLRRREFTDLFLSKSNARPQLLFVCQYWSELSIFSSPQPQNPDENSPPIIANYQMSFSFDDDGYVNGYDYEFSDVVNGLVCVVRDKRLLDGRKEETVPVICNPITRESLPLKKMKTRRCIERSMFGYDPIDKAFKVLAMTRGSSLVKGEHQVLTLGTDRWRMVECCIPGQHRSPHTWLCINGVLYYQSVCSYWRRISTICCFDIRSEKFRFIRFNETIPYATLINYNGNLGLLWSESESADVSFDSSFDKENTSLKLWVLEDVEKQEWSKRIIMLPTLWKDVVGENKLSVVGVTSTNEIVFKSLFPSGGFYLFYLNTDMNTIVRVEVEGIDRSKYHRVHIFINHVEDVKLIVDARNNHSENVLIPNVKSAKHD